MQHPEAPQGKGAAFLSKARLGCAAGKLCHRPWPCGSRMASRGARSCVGLCKHLKKCGFHSKLQRRLVHSGVFQRSVPRHLSEWPLLPAAAPTPNGAQRFSTLNPALSTLPFHSIFSKSPSADHNTFCHFFTETHWVHWIFFSNLSLSSQPSNCHTDSGAATPGYGSAMVKGILPKSMSSGAQ